MSQQQCLYGEDVSSRPKISTDREMLVPTVPEFMYASFSPLKYMHPESAINEIYANTRKLVTSAQQKYHVNEHAKSHDVVEQLHARFLQVASNWSNEAFVSADVSGGVDSAATIYLLKTIGATPALFNMKPDASSNDDALWASYIAKDVGLPLSCLGTVDQNSKAFDAVSDYPNGVLPEQPLYWSDSESYLCKIAERTNGHSRRLHLMGLGGDELFAPLPASAWSCAHEHPSQLVNIARKYCVAHHISFRQAIQDLMNHTSAELARSFNMAIANEPCANCGSSWQESIRIPSFLTNKARNILADLIVPQLEHWDIQSLNPDRSRHQALYSLLKQAQILHQVNMLFAPNHIEFRSLYLDPEIISLALSMPVGLRHQNGLNKALLHQTLEGIVPKLIFRRPNKGDHSKSLYCTWERSKNSLLAALTGGVLDEEHLINIPVIRQKISMPIPNIKFLFEMQRTAAVERWLRHAC